MRSPLNSLQLHAAVLQASRPRSMSVHSLVCDLNMKQHSRLAKGNAGVRLTLQSLDNNITDIRKTRSAGINTKTNDVCTVLRTRDVRAIILCTVCSTCKRLTCYKHNQVEQNNSPLYVIVIQLLPISLSFALVNEI